MTPTSPMITVILPLYNVWKYLDIAIDSVKQQTFTDFECLCLDDGSTNDMLERAKALTCDDSTFSCLFPRKFRCGGHA